MVDPLSFKASITLTAQRILTMLTSTADTIKLAAAVSECPIGIGLDNVLDTGAACPVAGPGSIAPLFFNDTIASGRLVASDASGRGVLHADITAGSYIVGILVGPTVAATGTIADVLVMPFFKSIP